jgi:ribosome-interacting GTPase 1
VPANLTPDYFQAEKRYRQAKTPEEKLEALEEMLSVMPKHKGTDRLRAVLTAKIAKLSEETERRLSTRRGSAYIIRREGAGQVILVGLPNVGKSQLVAAVTDASPVVADYPFTTKTPLPGMMKFEDVQIQMVDSPPLTDREARPWLSNFLRHADLLLLIVDLGQEPLGQMETLIEEMEKLKVNLEGRHSDGLLPQLKRAVIVGNKSDVEGSAEALAMLKSRYGEEFPVIGISAASGTGLDELKREVYKALGVIRVYTKAPGQKDLGQPMILKKGSTVN